jgi:hypothetical protein
MRAKLIFLSSAIFILFSLIASFNAKNAFAGVPADATPAFRDENIDAVTITFSGLTNGKDYSWCGDNDPSNCTDTDTSLVHFFKVTTGNSYSFTVCGDGASAVKPGACAPNAYFHASEYKVRIYEGTKCCIQGDIGLSDFVVKHYIPTPISLVSAGNPTPDTIMTLTVEGHRRPANDNSRNTYDIDLRGTNGTTNPGDPADFSVGAVGGGERKFGPLHVGEYILTLYYNGDTHNASNVLATYNIKVTTGGGSITGGATDNSTVNGGSSFDSGKNPCANGQCCTALGCIPTTVKDFTAKILSIAIGLAGGIAFILMVIGAIRILASSGDPKAVGAGREMFVAAVAGLIFLIFAVLILQFIGLNILKGVPGMG